MRGSARVGFPRLLRGTGGVCGRPAPPLARGGGTLGRVAVNRAEEDGGRGRRSGFVISVGQGGRSSLRPFLRPPFKRMSPPARASFLSLLNTPEKDDEPVPGEPRGALGEAREPGRRSRRRGRPGATHAHANRHQYRSDYRLRCMSSPRGPAGREIRTDANLLHPCPRAGASGFPAHPSMPAMSRRAHRAVSLGRAGDGPPGDGETRPKGGGPGPRGPPRAPRRPPAAPAAIRRAVPPGPRPWPRPPTAAPPLRGPPARPRPLGTPLPCRP